MFFRDRKEVKFKTFDLSQETELHCIYCFSNLTVHPVASHHGRGPNSTRRRWALGDKLLKRLIEKKKKENPIGDKYFCSLRPYLILALEFSSSNAPFVWPEDLVPGPSVSLTSIR